MLDLPAARHLLARTGFGPRPGEVAALVGRPRDAAVDDLLAGLRTTPSTSPPSWIDEPPPSPSERRTQADTLRQQQRERGRELKAWWWGELVATPSPLTERLVLLWHNHFTSSLREVKSPALHFRQNATWRRLAAGRFGDLLRAVTRDPAMLLYLDTARSTRQHPNENFARELLELFTLGEGHYTEEDVREAARAFTGWTLDRATGEFRFARRRHDSGFKTVLGRRGRFDGDDIVAILLEQPQLARHVTARVWRELVSDEPDPSALDALADAFRASDYDLRGLLRAVLTSDAFAQAPERGGRLKSPVELIVGTCRLFDLGPDRLTDLVRLGRRLGQDLFDPPSVKGWPGGAAWITSSTLVERARIVRQVAASRDLEAVVTDTVADDYADVLLARDPVDDVSGLVGLDRVRALLRDPAYQLI